jgi:hypothetical protein
MRFAWALSITPIATFLNSEYFLLVVSIVELTRCDRIPSMSSVMAVLTRFRCCRRFMWNFFRVEWEHITTEAHGTLEYSTSPF